MKSLNEISLPITEEEYRNDGAMHYSTLSSFARGGVHCIPTLFEKKESPALLFGSIVDTLITDGQEAFDKTYFVAEFPEVSDLISNVVKGLFNVYSETATSLNAVPDSAILAALDQVEYGKTWKSSTRIDKVRGPGSELYRLLYLAKDKIIVSQEMYNDAVKSVNALMTAPATKLLFEANNPFNKTIERFYQLKFRAYVNVDTDSVISANGLTETQIKDLLAKGYIPYSCMADEILVLNNQKKIIPIDLKTSSHYEDEFYESFIQWNYHIQARLYWRLIRAAMDNDEFFKDYTLDDYHFVVVNKKTLNPMVWKYEDTKSSVTIYYGKQGQYECQHPFRLGKELNWYLNNPECTYNRNLKIDKPNSLVEKLKSL